MSEGPRHISASLFNSALARPNPVLEAEGLKRSKSAAIICLAGKGKPASTKGRNGFRWYDAAWSACTELQLSPTQRLVLLVLTKFADKKGDCFPYLKTLRDHTGLSRRSVIYALRELEQKGALIVSPHLGRGQANKYRLKLQSIVENEGEGHED